MAMGLGGGDELGDPPVLCDFLVAMGEPGVGEGGDVPAMGEE